MPRPTAQERAAISLCVGQSHYGNLLVAETTKPHNWVAEERQDWHLPGALPGRPGAAAPLLPSTGTRPGPAQLGGALSLHRGPQAGFGRSPVPGLIIAAGFKSAAVLSAVVGECVAGLVTGDSCPWDLSPFMQKVKPLAP